MTATGRLEHERETPSLNVGWLLTLQQTQGFVAERHPTPGADMIFRCGTLAANRRRRPCERLHGIPCSKPSLKRPEPKPGQSPSQKHSTEIQSEVSAKALSKRGRQKTPQWGLIADYRARIGRKRHNGARNDGVQGPNARTIMRLASDVFAKHQVREIC